MGTLSGASGSIITASPNSGVNTADNLISARRDFAVRFTSPGTYQIWVRLRGPSSGMVSSTWA